MLSGLFFVTTLWAYALWAERRGAWRYVLVVVSLALGLMAKPMLVTTPFVLLLLDAWPLDRLGRRQVLEKLPLFAIVAIVVGITFGLWPAARAVRLDPVEALGGHGQ